MHIHICIIIKTKDELYIPSKIMKIYHYVKYTKNCNVKRFNVLQQPITKKTVSSSARTGGGSVKQRFDVALNFNYTIFDYVHRFFICETVILFLIAYLYHLCLK